MPADQDPLSLALAPPANETYEQRLVREAAEVEAKRVSDEIDERIRRERDREKKKKPIKLLLLGQCAQCSSRSALTLNAMPGQSESGKTATLKSTDRHHGAPPQPR